MKTYAKTCKKAGQNPKYLLLSKFRSTDSNRKKQEAWKNVARTIYAQSLAERSMDEVNKNNVLIIFFLPINNCRSKR